MDTRDDVIRRLRALAHQARAIGRAIDEESREGDDMLTPEWAARRFMQAARALAAGQETEARAIAGWTYMCWRASYAERDETIERWLGWGTTGPVLRARLMAMRERAREVVRQSSEAVTEAIAAAQGRRKRIAMREADRLSSRLSTAAKAEYALLCAIYELYAGEVDFARQSAARAYKHWRALGESEDDIVAAFVERGVVQ